MTSPTALRRSPQQDRSRRTIEGVLDAADRVLARDGAGGFGTTAVAAEAGISVGALYGWFPHKGAILEALALRHLAGFIELMDELAARAPLADPAGEVLDAFAAAFRARPGFRAMWFGGLRTERLRDVTRPGLEELASSLAQVLAAGRERIDPARIAAVSRMMVLVADALLRQAFRAHPTGDKALLAETKVLLRGYLEERLA